MSGTVQTALKENPFLGHVYIPRRDARLMARMLEEDALRKQR